MENSLLMKTDVSFALNFLIYIQNIFLNQSQTKEELKFPYLSTRISFNEDFEIMYKELWSEVSESISDDNISCEIRFYEEKDLFYQRLFEINSDSLKQFREIYKTFEVWWNSFAGRFSVERSIDEMGQNLYMDLADSLIKRGIKPEKALSISLIYDECLLANAEVSSYFAVLPIRDFFVQYKVLVSKLQECFY
ncbi:hypothetical protein AB1L05_16640 [Cytobacillus horneckiae]|uniref:hypothetical protein n=1 Tax=Cytobacillus horneckiae TaxID=549687 RepID=UPI0039A33163